MIRVVIIVAASLTASTVVFADEEALERRVRELERRLEPDRLAEDIEHYLDASDASFMVTADLLTAAGTSTATNDELLDLQAGDHDPRRRGFTLQQLEISLIGTVGEHLRGEGHVIVVLDPEEGETEVELEEAFLQTRDLPVEFEIGHFFAEFGVHNPQHPHGWTFVDKPVVLTAFLGGEGFRAPGFRLASVGETFRVHVGMQNAEDPSVASLSDFVYLVRIEAGLAGWQVGGSLLQSDDTTVWGIDVRRRWDRVRIQVEALGRESDEFGFYAQAVAELRGPWAIGIRVGYVDEADRTRVALLAAYELAETSRVRLQVNLDEADEDHVSVWFVFQIGIERGEAHEH